MATGKGSDDEAETGPDMEEFDMETKLRQDVSKLLEPTFRRANENQGLLKQLRTQTDIVRRKLEEAEFKIHKYAKKFEKIEDLTKDMNALQTEVAIVDGNWKNELDSLNIAKDKQAQQISVSEKFAAALEDRLNNVNAEISKIISSFNEEKERSVKETTDMRFDHQKHVANLKESIQSVDLKSNDALARIEGMEDGITQIINYKASSMSEFTNIKMLIDGLTLSKLEAVEFHTKMTQLRSDIDTFHQKQVMFARELEIQNAFNSRYLPIKIQACCAEIMRNVLDKKYTKRLDAYEATCAQRLSELLIAPPEHEHTDITKDAKDYVALIQVKEEKMKTLADLEAVEENEDIPEEQIKAQRAAKRAQLKQRDEAKKKGVEYVEPDADSPDADAAYENPDDSPGKRGRKRTQRERGQTQRRGTQRSPTTRSPAPKEPTPVPKTPTPVPSNKSPTPISMTPVPQDPTPEPKAESRKSSKAPTPAPESRQSSKAPTPVPVESLSKTDSIQHEESQNLEQEAPGSDAAIEQDQVEENTEGRSRKSSRKASRQASRQSKRTATRGNSPDTERSQQRIFSKRYSSADPTPEQAGNDEYAEQSYDNEGDQEVGNRFKRRKADSRQSRQDSKEVGYDESEDNPSEQEEVQPQKASKQRGKSVKIKEPADKPAPRTAAQKKEFARHTGYLTSVINDVPYSASEEENQEEDNDAGLEDDSDFATSEEEGSEDEFDAEEEIWNLKRKIRKVREFELDLERKLVDKMVRTQKNLFAGDEQCKLLINSLRKEVENVTKIRSKNRQEDKALMNSIKNTVNVAVEKVDSTAESIANLAVMGQGLMESNLIMQTILTGDEKDKNGLQLTGYKEQQGTQASTQGPKPMLSVNPQCVSCSGQVPFVMQAFKMACLSYSSNPVTYKDRKYTRNQILEVLKNSLDYTWNQVSYKAPYDKVQPINHGAIARKARKSPNKMKDSRVVSPLSPKYKTQPDDSYSVQLP